MARPLRLEFSGALYHVTSRGNRREDIFDDDDDRRQFLSVLQEVCNGYNWICHAYCLMSNHYHLLIETPDGNLSKGMRQLNGVYTQHFNRRHTRAGHVFQGRYKAILVDKDSYLLELARYIVLNPVRAGMVRSAVEWPWSSYRATAGLEKCSNWLRVDSLLAAFGRKKGMAVQAYRRFVSDGKNQPSLWQNLKNQVYLGDDAFVERMLSYIDQNKDLSDIPSAQRRPAPRSLEFYEKSAESRDAAIFQAYKSGGFSMKEIGDYFGLHYSRISRILAEAKGKA